MRYVISDTHFGHGNIIEYEDRPFDDVQEMDSALFDNWVDAVGHEDTVLFLGDVRHHPASMEAEWYLDALPGKHLVVRGNHDGGISQNSPTQVVEYCTIQHGRYQFYCEHRPIPECNAWQIHGHVHSHEPFIDFENQRINVSVEVIGYQPRSLDEIVHILDTVNRPVVEHYSDVAPELDSYRDS